MARVTLGALPDGSLGLRTSAFGADSFTGTDDGHSITFDSRWTDIAKISAIGIASEVLSDPFGVGGGFAAYFIQASYPNLGYKPFVEIRRLASNVVYDDWWSSTLTSGSYCVINPGGVIGQSNGASPSGSQMLFCAYQIPVPSN